MSARLWLVCAFSSELAAAVGDCRPCHAAIDASYGGSAMARTFSTDIGAVGDWDRRNTYFHSSSDRWYRLFRKDGVYYVRRWQRGYRDAETNVFEACIEYAVGSGAHARSFLYKAQDGRLFELPVSWYSGDGGHWAMSPGFDHASHADFRREVSPACLFCHAAYDARAAIDCERCHGPGAAHAAQPRPGRIVNPARLPKERSEEVCLQCHLQTTSRALPDAIRLRDRYLPGEPLAAQRLFFDHAPGRGMDDKFEVNSAAYRLRQSACKGLTCTTCHDAHHQRKVDVVAACRDCHTSDHARSETGCVTCHMPRRASDDAPHVTLTDHKIQRRPAPHQPSPEVYQGPVVPYFPSSPDALWLAIAQVRDGVNLDAGIRLLAPIAQSGGAQAAKELAEAYRKAGRYREAAEWSRRTGDMGRWGEMLLRLNDPVAAWQALNAGIAKNPRDVDTLLALGVAAGQRGELADSIRWFTRATEIRPEVPLAWLNLAVSLEQSGEIPRAEAAYREAIRWQPDFAAAHDHLSNLLAAKGDAAQARYEKSLAQRRGSP
jgi:Tfp pilus assembly protein PilF